MSPAADEVDRVEVFEPVAGPQVEHLREVVAAPRLVEFGRDGADLVFECAGIASTVQRAIDLVRRGGIVNLVGLASGMASVSPGAWLIKEATVFASLGYVHHEFAEVMDLITDRRVQS